VKPLFFLCQLLIAIFMQHGYLHGKEDVHAQARIAEEYVEAKDYDDALKEYEEALEKTYEGWEISALQYNTGNAFLLSGRPGEGLHSYYQAAQNGLFPELSARIAFNRAVAEMVRAKAVTKDKEENDAALEIVRIGLWRDVSAAARDAEQAFCSRDKALGAKECPATPDIATLKQLAQVGLAETIQQIDSRRVAEQTPDDGIPSLQLGISGLVELVQVISSPNIDPKISKTYQEFYSAIANEWVPLWDDLQAKKVPQPEAFLQAKNAFSEASSQVSNGEISAARQSLDVSSRQLQVVMDALYGEKSLVELLHVLLSGYTQALARGAIDKHVLQVAIRQMNELEKKVEGSKELSDEYHFLYGLNKSALEMVEDGDESGAAIVLQGAEITVRMMLSQLDEKPKTPKSVLQHLIQDQHGLLAINRAYQAKTGTEENSKISQMLAKLQGDLLVESRKFPEVMKLEESEQWKKGTFQELSASWVEISSLFDEGYSAASSAHDLFTETPKPSDQSISLQMLAFDDWMNALALLDKMKDREKDLESQPQAPTHAPPTAALMQQLESMEQDDKSLSSTLQKVHPEKVEKPW
jgi:hypothetical protein